jgi:hypothetical protein
LEVDGAYDYVDDAVDVLEGTVRRCERRVERQDNKVKFVEGEWEGMKKFQKGKERLGQINVALAPPPSLRSLVAHYMPGWFKTISGVQRKYLANSSSPTSTKLRMGSPRLMTIPEERRSDLPKILAWIPGASLLLSLARLFTFPLRAFIGLLSKHTS